VYKGVDVPALPVQIGERGTQMTDLWSESAPGIEVEFLGHFPGPDPIGAQIDDHVILLEL
jgi:hypothetical protein